MCTMFQPVCARWGKQQTHRTAYTLTHLANGGEENLCASSFRSHTFHRASRSGVSSTTWMGEAESLTKEHGSMVHIRRMTGVCSGNNRTPRQPVLASES
jgi:hypothetical protein